MKYFRIVQDDRKSNPKVLIVQMPLNKNIYDAEKFALSYLKKEGINARVAKEYTSRRIGSGTVAVRWEPTESQMENKMTKKQLIEMVQRVLKEEVLDQEQKFEAVKKFYEDNKNNPKFDSLFDRLFAGSKVSSNFLTVLTVYKLHPYQKFLQKNTPTTSKQFIDKLYDTFSPFLP